MTRLILLNIVDSYRGLDAVGGVRLYPTREQIGSMERDLLWLPSGLENQADYMRGHYKTVVGLPTSDHLLFTDDWRDLRLSDYDIDLSLVQPHPFIMNESMRQWLKNNIGNQSLGFDKWSRSAQRFESKRNFIRLCKGLRIRVPETLFMEDVHARDIFEGNDESLLFKLDRSASGLGMMAVSNERELGHARVATQYRDFLLQKKVRLALELGVQINLSEGLVPRIIAITGQHVGVNNDHMGNYHPYTARTQVKINEVALKHDLMRLCFVMHHAGMRGRVGVDVLVSPDGEYYLSEVNARRTGATPYIDAANRLGVSSWSSMSLPTTARCVTDLDLNTNKLIYRPGRDEGLLLINWGPICEGKVGVMFIGSPDKWERLEHEARSWLESN